MVHTPKTPKQAPLHEHSGPSSLTFCYQGGFFFWINFVGSQLNIDTVPPTKLDEKHNSPAWLILFSFFMFLPTHFYTSINYQFIHLDFSTFHRT